MNASLTRIIIFCKDTEVLKSFYTHNFNFAVVENIEHEWVILNAGVIEIGLHRIGEAYNISEKFKANTNTKLVFKVDAINQLRKRLMKKGATMKELKSFNGINVLFCDGEDPEGNIFQLMQPN